MNRKKRVHIGLGSAVLAAALVLSGCGTGETPSGEDSVQGISEDGVIKLGTFVPRSGPLAGIGSAPVDGASIVFDEINAAGGVNGYTIEMVEIDDAYDPARSAAAARTLWEEDRVFALFHPYGSSQVQAANAYIVQNDVPLLFPFSSYDNFMNDGVVDENFIGFYPPYRYMVSTLLNYAESELGATTVGVVNTTEEFGKTGYAGYEHYMDELSLTRGLHIEYDLAETDYVSIGRQIANSGDDAVLVWSVPGGAQIIQAAEDAGYEGDWLVQTGLIGATAEELYATIPALDGRLFLANFATMFSDARPGVTEFRDTFQSRFPGADVNFGLMGYTNALVLVGAIEQATEGGEPLNWPRLKDALLSIDGLDIGNSVGLSYIDNRMGNVSGAVYVWQDEDWLLDGDFKPFEFDAH